MNHPCLLGLTVLLYPRTGLISRPCHRGDSMVPAFLRQFGFRMEAPVFFTRHMDRFHASWEALFETPAPDISWELIIKNLVLANGLTGKVAAAKIMAAVGGGAPLSTMAGGSDFLAVFIRPYVHRLEVLKKPGLALMTYPFFRHTPLADHKTLNYFFYDRAGHYAKAHRADEALILNPDETLSETNTGSLMALSGNCLYLPQSSHVLPGVTGRIASELLEKQGYQVIEKRMTLEDIRGMDHVCVANALMGVVPVLSIDDYPFCPATNLCLYLNEHLHKKGLDLAPSPLTHNKPAGEII